jgi:hypothetical protein
MDTPFALLPAGYLWSVTLVSVPWKKISDNEAARLAMNAR